MRSGVLNVVHGGRPAVTGILDHPDIRAVSFVGSDQAGKFIYERGSANGKRVQVCPWGSGACEFGAGSGAPIFAQGPATLVGRALCMRRCT